MADNRQKMIDKGYKFYCNCCRAVYREIPYEDHYDGHCFRKLAMCNCGSDVICNLSDDRISKR